LSGNLVGQFGERKQVGFDNKAAKGRLFSFH